MFHSQDCRHPRSDTGTCSHSCLRKWTLDTPVGTAITTNCTPPKLIHIHFYIFKAAPSASAAYYSSSVFIKSLTSSPMYPGWQ